jgi:hypothetical protein
VVTKAFRERGHEAYSCDTEPTEGNLNWHIQDDVLKHLHESWDLMIAHPPCTYLCVTGNKWFKPEYKDRFPNRQQQREEAIAFFMALANAPIRRIAMENPVCIMSTVWRPADQVIQPWQFGDNQLKKTCLWLKNLPLLRYGREVQMMLGETAPPQSEIVQPEFVTYHSRTNKGNKSRYRMAWAGKVKETKFPLLWKASPSEHRQRERSRTFPGIANAMAEQWG